MPDAHSLNAQSPWPGLAAYDELSSAFFKGRKNEAEALERLVRLAPLVALYGRSGLGKSSLLQAGLFPRLRSTGMLPVYVRIDFSRHATAPPMEQMARRLEQEISAHQLDAPERRVGESLWHWLHAKNFEVWTAGNQPMVPVFVLDQFEELFSMTGGDTQRIASVFDALADLAENRITEDIASDRTRSAGLDVLTQRYRMLLSFREDYLPEMRVWERAVPSLLRHYQRLEPMSPEQARIAVAESGQAVLAPGVASLIVDFVGGLGGDARRGATTIEPALLSLTCTQLNLRRAGKLIDADLLKSAGENILEGFYRDALADMPAGVHRFIENHLLQGERTRGSYALDEALSQHFITQEQLDVLTRERRLLRVESQGDVSRIELIHDRLVDVVRAARRARLAAEAAERDSEQERQAALSRIAEEQAARAQAEREARTRAEADAARLRRIRNALVTSLVVVIALFAFAAWQTLKAQQSADKEAQSRQEAENERSEAVKQAELARDRLADVERIARYGWIGDEKSVAEGELADDEIQRIQRAETAQDRDRHAQTTIEIWAKDVDQGKVRSALGELNFPVMVRDAYVKELATNSLWFGSATPIDDVKLVALALMRSGVQLRAIRPIQREIVARRDQALIQIGADVSVVNNDPYSVKRLMASTEFPR